MGLLFVTKQMVNAFAKTTSKEGSVMSAKETLLDWIGILILAVIRVTVIRQVTVILIVASS